MKRCDCPQVDDLEEYISDPVKQHYLVRSLPARMKRQLLYRRWPSFPPPVSVFTAVSSNLPLFCSLFQEVHLCFSREPPEVGLHGFAALCSHREVQRERPGLPQLVVSSSSSRHEASANYSCLSLHLHRPSFIWSATPALLTPPALNRITGWSQNRLTDRLSGASTRSTAPKMWRVTGSTWCASASIRHWVRVCTHTVKVDNAQHRRRWKHHICVSFQGSCALGGTSLRRKWIHPSSMTATCLWD